MRAEFRPVINFECPHDWTPGDKSKISIRLPKSFHIHRDTIYWVQDVINITSKKTLLSPLVTVIKHDKLLQATEATSEHQFGRWTCGVRDPISSVITV
jgi:hypothetical protein